jgi:hypothetical protein
MKIFVLSAITALAMAVSASSSVQSASIPVWCANSGFDNGPPRSRGPGSGTYWLGEPTDCQSIWRRGYYRGTDPDPNIRLQLMRYRPVSKKDRRPRRK